VLFANADNVLRFKIDGDITPDHVTELPVPWLRDYCNCKQCFEKTLNERDVISQHTYSSKYETREVPTVDYKEIVSNEDRGLFKYVYSGLFVRVCRRNVRM